MKKFPLPLGIIPLLAFACSAVRADITITPTFSASITKLGDASTIEATIDSAISTFEADIANPISVNINFVVNSSGLGASNSEQADLSYSTYLSDLEGVANQSASDKTAIASLPKGPDTGIQHNSKVIVTSALFAALGDQAEATTLENEDGGFDGTIYLNIGAMNVSRTGAQDPNKYDLESVASHEIDEILGIGGSGCSLYQSGNAIPSTLPANGIGTLDLFRYRGVRERTLTYNPFAPAYFSINGGKTDLTNFNQNGQGGSDFGDWAGAAQPQVQDAFGNPGTEPDLGVNELTALDVIGYTLASPVASVGLARQTISTQAVPEPGAYVSLGFAGLIFAALHRRRVA